MSKKYKIRWQASDLERLEKAVRNFNRKIDRIAKKYPELKNALPEKVTVKQYTNLINTRQDLNRELNSLKRFTDRNNKISVNPDGTYTGIEIYGDYNIKITTWARKEINRRIATINVKRKKRLDALQEKEVKSRGVEQGYKVGQVGVGNIQQIDLAPMEGLTAGASEESVRRKFKSVLIQSQSDFLTLRDFRTRNSYITGLYRNFNENDIDEIVAAIENMPIAEFLDVFNSDNDAKFEGLYPGNKQQEQEYVKSLKAVWIPKKKK